MPRRSWSCVLLIGTVGLGGAILGLGGCSDSNSAADLALLADLAMVDATVPTVALTGALYDPRKAGTAALIAGATVCLLPEPGTCVTSDTSGVYSLRVPAKTDVQVRFSSTGFVTDVFPLHLDADNEDFGVSMVPTDAYAMLQATAGKTQAADKGALIVTLLKGAGGILNDATLELVPAAGDGPFYYQTRAPDAVLGSSTGQGFTIFYNLPPTAGVELKITTKTGQACFANSAWEGTGGRFRGPIHADQLTSFAITCE